MTELGQRQAAFPSAASPFEARSRRFTTRRGVGRRGDSARLPRAPRYGGGCPGGHTCLLSVTRLVRPGWVDPLALGICLLGLAAAAGVLVRPLRRFIAAALILSAAVGGAVALSGHRVLGAEYSCPGTAGNPCFYHPRPVWEVPTMAGLVVLGLAGAVCILLATRRRT
jgi:hypothetical protein